MSDSKNQNALLWNASRPVSPAPTSGELLYEVHRSGDVIRCELRVGEHGVDAQFLRNGELWSSRFFGTWLSRTQTPRTLAVQWAETQRQRLEGERTS